jgi:hypothetical protein
MTELSLNRVILYLGSCPVCFRMCNNISGFCSLELLPLPQFWVDIQLFLDISWGMKAPPAEKP